MVTGVSEGRDLLDLKRRAKTGSIFSTGADWIVTQAPALPQANGLCTIAENEQDGDECEMDLAEAESLVTKEEEEQRRTRAGSSRRRGSVQHSLQRAGARRFSMSCGDLTMFAGDTDDGADSGSRRSSIKAIEIVVKPLRVLPKFMNAWSLQDVMYWFTTLQFVDPGRKVATGADSSRIEWGQYYAQLFRDLSKCC